MMHARPAVSLDRRAFLALGLLASPIAAAQPAARVFKVGVVSLGTDPARPRDWEPFLDGMRALNNVEGQNLVIRRAFASSPRSSSS